MAEYLADDLINQVKTECHSPPNVEDSEVLGFLNRELQKNVFPLILSCNEGYFLKYKDIANSSNGVLLTSRMGGGVLHDVKGYTGTYSSPSDLYDLARVEIDEIDTNGFPAFYIQGNTLFTNPGTNFTGNLRLFYFHRPSEMVAAADCAVISSIDTTNKQVVVSSVPSGITTSVLADFVQAKPQFEPLGIDYTISSIVSTTITFSTDLPAGLAVGDYVCVAEKSPVPQIPFEAFDLLVFGAALRLLRAARDPQGVQIMAAAVAEEKVKLKSLFQPRIDAAPQTVTGSGMFRFRI